MILFENNLRIPIFETNLGKVDRLKNIMAFICGFLNERWELF